MKRKSKEDHPLLARSFHGGARRLPTIRPSAIIGSWSIIRGRVTSPPPIGLELHARALAVSLQRGGALVPRKGTDDTLELQVPTPPPHPWGCHGVANGFEGQHRSQRKAGCKKLRKKLNTAMPSRRGRFVATMDDPFGHPLSSIHHIASIIE